MPALAWIAWQQVLPAKLRRMWAHLQSAVPHYVRGEHPYSPEACAQGKEDLLRFATLAEGYGLPPHFFTANLHWAVCRLPQQEATRGQVCV